MILRAWFILIFCLSMFSGLSEASAGAKYDLKEITPQIKTALDARRDRFELVRNLKEQGIAGENNQGYLELFEDQPGAKEIVAGENNDRKVIYRAIAEQNHLTDAMATIEQVFAQVQRESAEPGDKIQTESGEWISK